MEEHPTRRASASSVGVGAQPGPPGDIYPPTVRRLKSLLLDGMLALVEGRLDSQIHVPQPTTLLDMYGGCVGLEMVDGWYHRSEKFWLM